MTRFEPSTTTSYLPLLIKAIAFVQKHWFNTALVLIALHLFFQRDVTIQFNLTSTEQTALATADMGMGFDGQPVNTSLLLPVSTEQELEKKTQEHIVKKWKDNRANTFSNLTFILSPTYAKRNNVPQAVVDEKVELVKAYVAKFVPIAIREREQYGIPVSITLAQGLLESNAGESRLSLESNNHFGIKCRSKCRGCTCRNYSDDSHYDMFRVFDSSWESYREHSILLSSDRYKHLLKYPVSDYKSWAHGLKKAGYATDKRYAEKLIQIIEFLNLHKYDEAA